MQGGGNTGWYVLTEAVKMFGPAATTHEFSEKLMKWQAHVRGESTNCGTFKMLAVEAANFPVFVGMVKGDAELKLFHLMLKYNYSLVSQISREL